MEILNQPFFSNNTQFDNYDAVVIAYSYDNNREITYIFSQDIKADKDIIYLNYNITTSLDVKSELIGKKWNY